MQLVVYLTHFCISHTRDHFLATLRGITCLNIVKYRRPSLRGGHRAESGTLNLAIYQDSDWAMGQTSRKLYSGNVLNGDLVAWFIQK